MMGDGFGMGFGGGFMWLFWILLIAVIAWIVKTAMDSRGSPLDQERSALDILKERYAKGEIDREEFQQKRKDLDG